MNTLLHYDIGNVHIGQGRTELRSGISLQHQDVFLAGFKVPVANEGLKAVFLTGRAVGLGQKHLAYTVRRIGRVPNSIQGCVCRQDVNCHSAVIRGNCVVHSQGEVTAAGALDLERHPGIRLAVYIHTRILIEADVLAGILIHIIVVFRQILAGCDPLPVDSAAVPEGFDLIIGRGIASFLGSRCIVAILTQRLQDTGVLVSNVEIINDAIVGRQLLDFCIRYQAVLGHLDMVHIHLLAVGELEHHYIFVFCAEGIFTKIEVAFAVDQRALDQAVVSGHSSFNFLIAHCNAGLCGDQVDIRNDRALCIAVQAHIISACTGC